MTSPQRIVVGHDGSPFSESALSWALEWARRASLDVTVVRGWSMTTAPRPATAARGYVPPFADFAEAVRLRLEQDTAKQRADFEDVTVSFEAPHSAPANALLELSADAALVVVGPRGRGGFRGLVLGSVAEQVSRHASCPVVIVRGTGDPAETERSIELDAGLGE
ncbi:universal stress protein [Aeromicrobium sp. CF4.19]|uniref:universal stress protein n=1 Tax=Aeromicrobium sp. CF4.19 TaxID=3373082 RepID=UPI003EE6169D